MTTERHFVCVVFVFNFFVRNADMSQIIKTILKLTQFYVFILITANYSVAAQKSFPKQKKKIMTYI